MIREVNMEKDSTNNSTTGKDSTYNSQPSTTTSKDLAGELPVVKKNTPPNVKTPKKGITLDLPESNQSTTKVETSKVSITKEESLIPVKGIDVERRKYLQQLGINTVSDLLQQGRLIEQRKNIALSLLSMEMKIQQANKNYDIWMKRYIKYVNSWVKQVNLWRVSGMDADTSYFLVELGVRHIEDLTKVDVNKAYDIMKCLHNNQPEFELVTIGTLENLIKNSKIIPSSNSEYQDRLIAKLNNSLRRTRVKSEELRKFKNLISEIAIEDIIGGSSIECDDPVPTFLFRDNLNEELLRTPTDSMEVIQKGLGFLQDIELSLPLPRTLRGTIYMLKSGESLPTKEEARQNYAFYDALVEISGISSSSEDKTENSSKPQGYTDSKGDFVIVMPDKYNMQEAVTITISKGNNKQKFVLGASDIINHVDKQKILKAFNELDVIYSDIQEDQAKLDFITRISEIKESPVQEVNDEDNIKFKLLSPKKDLIIKEIEILENKKKELEALIKDSDDTTNDLERILRNLTLCDNLVSDFRKEAFVLNEDVFKGYRTDQKKVLPSVKLMGNDNDAIYLPTDTAPSRVFNYSMLQRLVEPAISPLADPNNDNPRISLAQGVDVMKFKNTIARSPEQWPQMSSLGIGYVLNMHQAWVPDGFALGNLLYSLILAPGEEQRLVVREKSQSYKITDTADGSDYTSENYATSQFDNTTAAYEYALGQLSEANSNYNYSTRSTSFGMSAGASGFGAMLGLSGGISKTSGKASSSASQSNAHNEASNAAQGFQHEIKTSSEKVSQANRLSISMATGEESNSVATRIIANHNHSHAMTIQYWEVMRRYRLETCVDGVDLVLFVPLKLINFLNGQDYQLDSTKFDINTFRTRYEVILKSADALETGLPYKYKNGLNLITKYAAYPKWIFDNADLSQRKITLTFKGIFLSFDNINVTMFLKDGKGRIAGNVTYERKELFQNYETTASLKETIKKLRNQSSDLKICKCEFTLPGNITDDDLSSIRIENSCDELEYVLFKNINAKGVDGRDASTLYEKMMHEVLNLAKDNDNSDGDRKNIAYYKEMLPESWVSPNIRLSTRDLNMLGHLTISNVNLVGSSDNQLTAMLSSSVLSPSVSIAISSSAPTLRYSQLQQIEATMHHIVSNTMKYSQVIWASLSSDERALMLEQYTIDMPNNDTIENDGIDDVTLLPLLNCINVKKLLGFYGNCMLFPFTYPQKLADNIGKTAVELQDSLYKYHTNYFRVPSTVISLPTDGMIGEAVLGETNVSEEIDLTRFWNWKDSPIDSMSIDSSYLNNSDYLAGKTTKDISALNLQGASATTPVTAADLVSALINKQTPSFDNITGLDNLKDVLNTATNSAAKGRDHALTVSSDMAKTVMDYAYKSEQLEKQNKSANTEKNKNSDESSDNSKKNSSVKNDGSEDSNTSVEDNGSEDSDTSVEDNVSEDKSTSAEDDALEDSKESAENDDVKSQDSDKQINFNLLEQILRKTIEIKANNKDTSSPIQEIPDSKMTKGEITSLAGKLCSEYGICFDSTDDSIK